MGLPRCEEKKLPWKFNMRYGRPDFFYGWMLNYQELPIFGRCQLCIVNEGNQTNKHNFEAPPLLGGNDRDTQCWDPYCQTTPTLLPWYETRIQYSGKEAFGSYGNRGVILEYPWTCTKVVSPLLSWFPKKPFSRDIFPQIHIVIQRKFSWNTSELRTIVMVSAAFPPSCQPHNHVNHTIMSTTHHQIVGKWNSSGTCEFTGEETLNAKPVFFV